MTQCVIYTRVSSVSQARGDGLIRQLECCTRFARKHNLWIVGVFTDVASSNGLDPLPGRRDAADMVRENRSNRVLLVEGIDRLSRAGSLDVSQFDDIKILQCDELAGAMEDFLTGLLRDTLSPSVRDKLPRNKLCQ